MRNPVFFHLEHDSGGFVTARVEQVQSPADGELAEGDMLAEITFAFCSPKDAFNRKKGVVIATGRHEHQHVHKDESGNVVQPPPIHAVHRIVIPKDQKIRDAVVGLIESWEAAGRIGYCEPLPRWWGSQAAEWSPDCDAAAAHWKEQPEKARRHVIGNMTVDKDEWQRATPEEEEYEGEAKANHKAYAVAIALLDAAGR